MSSNGNLFLNPFYDGSGDEAPTLPPSVQVLLILALLLAHNSCFQDVLEDGDGGCGGDGAEGFVVTVPGDGEASQIWISPDYLDNLQNPKVR